MDTLPLRELGAWKWEANNFRFKGEIGEAKRSDRTRMSRNIRLVILVKALLPALWSVRACAVTAAAIGVLERRVHGRRYK